MTLDPVPTDVLWRQFKDELHRFLRRRLPTDEDADDVLQEVFLRIHEGSASLRDQQRAHAWIYSIARRTVADFYRARERHAAATQPLHAVPEPAEPVTEPAGNLSAYAGGHDVHEEVLSWMLPLISGLPEPYRTALYMADVEGRTQQAVADHFGLSRSGAKSRVQRARRMLGELVQACCEVEFGPEGRAVAFSRRIPRCHDDC